MSQDFYSQSNKPGNFKLNTNHPLQINSSASLLRTPIPLSPLLAFSLLQTLIESCLDGFQVIRHILVYTSPV